MTITITLKGALLTVIAILGIILLIYLIMLVANLIKTLKKTNEILGDAKVVSEIAADKVKMVDGMVDDLGESVGTIVKTLKGNQSVIAAATNVINAVSNFASLIKKSEDKKKPKDQNQ